jgi:filamentous hemagglutinin family protein
MDSLIQRSAAIVFVVGHLSTPVLAQVLPDGTLPTTVTSPDGRNFSIEGGSRSGNNLFHSFSQFSIPTGGAAVFNHSVDVQNIFSRVTGSTLSNIDGLIRANGSVNLFLLNPSGIVFGPNAQLNIGGSFLGTTASHIQFDDGVAFGTVNPTALLTMSVPIGLQMGQTPGTIQVNNSGHQVALVGSGLLPLDRSKTPPGLQVPVGKTLALIGGEVTLVGGIVQAPGGHIELGSVRAGAVNLAPTKQGWAFDYAPTSQFQDIQLSQKALVDASGNGGSMQLRGQNILFSNSSALIQHTGSQKGGDVVLNATDSIAFSQSQPASFTMRLETQTLGSGSTGEVQVTAQHLRLQNGASINTASYASGGSGAIRVNVAESIELFGAFPGDLSPEVSRIAASSFSGNSGDILIATKQISLRDGANIASFTFGNNSNSGNVIITATDFIKMLGVKPNILPSGLSTVTYSNGNGGTLTVNTPKLLLQDGGRISSSTFASGNAGNVVVNVSERLDVSGVGVDTFQDPSAIVASALSPNPIFQRILRLPSVPTGNAGNITLNTPQLSISNGAQVGVNNIGTGNAGNLTIAADRIRLSNQGKITASTASGQGGNIALNLGEALILRQGSQIETQAFGGNGSGGNIRLNAPVILGLENSDIIANAFEGKGGNINITTQGVIGLEFRNTLTPRTDSTNDITASSQFSVNGTVKINNIGVDPNSGLVILPVDIVDPSQKIATGCAVSSDSSFVATGRGGVPQNPMQVLEIDSTWSDLRSISQAKPEPKIVAAAIAIEATALATNAQGQTELIAQGAIAAPNIVATCGKKSI